MSPNVKEKCGATPLTLAVIKGDEEMVQLLIDNFSICDENYFISVPATNAIAKKLGFSNISSLIENCLAAKKEQDKRVWKITDGGTTEQSLISENESLMGVDENENYSRPLKNCRTLAVGDKGTNKIIRSVKVKSQSAYDNGHQRFLEICMQEVSYYVVVFITCDQCTVTSG